MESAEKTRMWDTYVRSGADSDQTELTEKVTRQDQQIKKLLEQLADLAKQKQHVEKVLNGVLASKSWKLTKPLRTSISLLHAVKGLLRFKVFHLPLEAGRGVTKENSMLQVKGSSPTIQLKNLSSNRFPSGWVEISGDLKSSRDLIIFLLYYRLGQGFNGADRLFLPLGSETKTLVKLPAGIKEFRLDPFNEEVTFTLPHISVRELGSLQLITRVLVRQLRGVRKNPRAGLVKAQKAWSVFRSGGVSGLRMKLFKENSTQSYEDWVKKYDTLTAQDKQKISEHCKQLAESPLISILMPTYNTPERWLVLAIESVCNQLYQNWELCIADDCSTEPHVRKILNSYAAKDSRIKVLYRSVNGHIGEASNSALQMATGTYVTLLDHDDELTAHALYMMAVEINAHPEASFIYSDEDKITGFGMRFNPHFKSDWNPDLFTSQMYTCHLTLYKKSVVDSVGGFKPGFDGAQDWDLALRVADSIPEAQIRHIPHILYHWRSIEGSTAQSTDAKPYVLASQKRAVEEHLTRRGYTQAKVSILHDISHVRVGYTVPSPEPLVSIIIPTKDQASLLERCVVGVLKNTAYHNLEILIVDNNSQEEETQTCFRKLCFDKRVRILKESGPFNFSRINNHAVKEARGSLLAFLNNDLEVINDTWLLEMVSHAVRKEVGAVGARLLFPNGLLQHGGVILGVGGVAGHNHKGRLRHDPGYFNRAILVQDLSAVTAACLVMRRDIFDLVGGFDEGSLAVAFNDVDLCLKVREKGFRVVYNPYAELYHHESASRGYETTPEKFSRFESEIEAMQSRWKKVLAQDPYYNPNLTLLTEDFAFAHPPRTTKPWKTIS